MTLGAWLETWVTIYIEPAKLADSTKAQYSRSVAAVPASLAGIDLERLSALDCMRWLVHVAKDHPRAAQLDRVMLSRALRIAGKLGYCARDLIDQDTCPTPAHEAREALILDAEQLGRYLDAAASTDVYPLLLLCCCGLRRGEALGVRRDCFDWDAGTLHIRGQRLRVRRRYRYAPLKSRRSDRVLKLPPWVLDVCRAWPAQLRSPYLVNTTPEHLHKAHAALIEAEGLPHVTLHGLRHTMASLAADQGVPLKALQFALGHATMSLTADLYADHLPSEVNAVPSLVFQGIRHA